MPTCISLVPAAAGSFSFRLTMLLISPRPMPQPEAPGIDSELSTFRLPVTTKTSPTCAERTDLPLIGLFGAGGLVVPVIRLTLTGFELVPIWQPGPMIGFWSVSFSGIWRPCEKRSNLTCEGEPARTAFAVTALPGSGKSMPRRPPGT